jgi:hypothetical protein
MRIPPLTLPVFPGFCVSEHGLGHASARSDTVSSKSRRAAGARIQKSEECFHPLRLPLAASRHHSRMAVFMRLSNRTTFTLSPQRLPQTANRFALSPAIDRQQCASRR